MQILSLVWGILAFVGMFISLLPCFGSLNWINIPFAFIGLIVSIIAINSVPQGEKNVNALAGIILCSIAVLLGIIRLIFGFGII